MAATPGPTERECTELVAHAVALYAAEVKATNQTPYPTTDEAAKIEADLRTQFVADCRTTTQEHYRCGRAAKTLDELANCQATPSSSTSNSSVAPPGITPAAPLSP